ncbi:MAG: hypothetical protein A3B91_05050 [Candidatus Yanofskybacteria bacterium RIFCSPHIGHO2_02_FULL_41_29]|uniref:Uncharacterized protein n=2 Tax=Patescibacteria group TaxID=1783273 RepID=A0A1F5NI98_9BACT|nr:MAG: hypothetical protein A3J19_03175 [Candidatus Daviesbacteria bacterium RIFCSPLOWO2_02_FULL_41_8]OGN00688.1 MAG: hypothetical protein A2650_04050 [Candidatus Yanofskybacteria bacterium RIFCSPHIGHO2_01_FULL_41_53]OGN11663.1 MAG: hypothetical protein A3B91_05050 [Candidatus Yanofskybacteria bacterium RIFCSPHIGHO2_02_FULL_41_29]OGN23423.1 MAG: hypothetical protein A2916_03440 [Candidatus Yanofskybacteria bacterium RIFCSPLOWO2_01_FULL_41_67]
MSYSYKVKKTNRVCERCDSRYLRLEKWIYGKKNRQTKKAKIICLDCSHRRAVSITKDLFELTRVIRWRHKRKKLLEKEGYSYLILK